MQNAAAMPIATSMLRGASLQRSPESCAKKAKNGILMPAWWNTPAEANNSTSQTHPYPSFNAALITIDLLTNPLNSGNAEIDAAPIMHKTVVTGMLL